ncbi:MAG: hypothetical protein RSE05_10220 [Clostridium sp.]
MKETKITLEEAADMLRSMLDEEQEVNEQLRQRNKTLELLLMENDITIPDYGSWHGVFHMI